MLAGSLMSKTQNKIPSAHKYFGFKMKLSIFPLWIPVSNINLFTNISTLEVYAFLNIAKINTAVDWLNIQ